MMKRLLSLSLSFLILYQPSYANAHPLLRFAWKHRKAIINTIGVVGSIADIKSAFASGDEDQKLNERDFLEALSIYEDLQHVSNPEMKRSFITRMDQILRRVHTSADSPILKSTSALMLGKINEDFDQKELSQSWFLKALHTPMPTGYFSSSVNEDIKFSTMKREAASSLCRMNFSDQAGMDKNYYCTVAYLYNKYTSNPYLTSLERCVIQKDKTECGHLGTRLVTDSISQDHVDNYERNVVAKPNLEADIYAALSTLLPISELTKDYKTLDTNTLIQIYWIAVAFESLGELESAAKIYANLCQTSFRSQNELNVRIVKSCDILPLKRFWTTLDLEMQLSLILPSCAKGKTGGMCLRAVLDEKLQAWLASERLSFERLVSFRVMNMQIGDMRALYIPYVLSKKRSADTYLSIRSIDFSAKNAQGVAWDTFGMPDVLVEGYAAGGVQVFKGTYKVTQRGEDHLFAAIDEEIVLPFSKAELSNINIKVYDLDQTERELIADFNVQLPQQTKLSSYQHGVINSVMMSTQLITGELPYDKISKDLNKSK